MNLKGIGSREAFHLGELRHYIEHLLRSQSVNAGGCDDNESQPAARNELIVFHLQSEFGLNRHAHTVSHPLRVGVSDS